MIRQSPNSFLIPTIRRGEASIDEETVVTRTSFDFSDSPKSRKFFKTAKIYPQLENFRAPSELKVFGRFYSTHNLQ